MTAPVEVKRPSVPRILTTIAPPLAAVVIALMFAGILIAATDAQTAPKWSYFFANPGAAIGGSLDVIGRAVGALIAGSIFDPTVTSQVVSGAQPISALFIPLSNTLGAAAPLALAALAVGLCLRAALFNVGAEGQFIVGAAAGAYVGFSWHLPPVLHPIVALALAAACGAIWGLIPGVLRATTGASEVISTIMLNYIAGFGLLLLLGSPILQRPGRQDPISPIVDDTARLPTLAAGIQVTWGLVVAVLATILLWFLLNRTAMGFTLKVVGLNPRASLGMGLPVARVVIGTFAAAGALAAVGGATMVLGTTGSVNPGTATAIGFNAITAALLGKGRPGATFGAAVLVAALQTGGLTMQAATGTDVNVVLVLQSTVVLLIAAPMVLNALLPRALRAPAAIMAGGWG